MKKFLFIDRDGTLIYEPEDEQVDSFQKLKFLPGVFTHLSRIARELDFELIMVTNQDGLGTDSFPESDFWPVQNRMLETLSGEGIDFEEVLIDRSFPHENLETRKPGVGMLKAYMNQDTDWANSFVIGDRLTDAELATNLGCRAILIGKGDQSESDIVLVSGWSDIANYLFSIEKTAELERISKETSIRIGVSLLGTGQSSISTGIGFFDHMLEQIARHSGADLTIEVDGDLSVDEHHTVEDTALVLGQAFREAWGDLKGMNRYGFVLPMDDSEALISLDLGGRPYLKWEAEFSRERVGDLPTELFSHFFRSFSDGSRSTIHVKASGSNEHHKIEAIFKAFARAMSQAWKSSGSEMLPTTKGLIDSF